MSGVFEFVRGMRRAWCSTAAAAYYAWVALPRPRHRASARTAYAHQPRDGPHRHQHARPGVLGLLHRQLHLPRRRRGGGGAARHPRLRLPLEADQGGRGPRRAARRSARSSCACSSSLVDIGRPDRFLAPDAVIGTPNFPRSLLAWDVLVLNVYLVAEPGRSSPTCSSRRYRGEAYDKRIFAAARAALDPGGDLHPHRDRVPLQRHGGAAVLERVDPGAALPRLGVLLRPGGHDHPLPGPAQDARASRSRTRRSGRSPS